jgi:hypothetical protein
MLTHERTFQNGREMAKQTAYALNGSEPFPSPNFASVLFGALALRKNVGRPDGLARTSVRHVFLGKHGYDPCPRALKCPDSNQRPSR